MTEPGRPTPPGGFTDPANYHITDFRQVEALFSCVKLKGEVEKLIYDGKTFQIYHPISYQSQVVNGKNYKSLVYVVGARSAIGAYVEMTAYYSLDPTMMPVLLNAEWLGEALTQRTEK
ncbi:Hypp8517 [Branchiostoma lanceolatum]|uniref:Hypp8517 protein n=1 Tax=Branchiostoma lanceolatum TaxID=7740 RepID=A0A8J9Z7I1_BRALA|nr:Hypp8517 [Branchiostoma lanceolatum]